MMKNTFLALLFFPYQLFAQNTISGKLLDNLTDQPIAYAHIFAQQSGVGTVSNENGEFYLRFPNPASTDTLVITHISYQQQKIPLSELVTSDSSLNTIPLTSNIVNLEEVIVVDREIMPIVNKIMEQLRDSPIKHGKAFYRQISFKDSVAMEWIESFYKVSSSNNGIDKLKIDQARFARKKYDTANVFLSFTNFSYLSVAHQLYAPRSEKDTTTRIGKPFSENFTEDYDFHVEKTYKKGADTYYVIGYQPNRQMQNSVNLYGNCIYNVSKNSLIQYTAFVDHSLGFDQIKEYDGSKTIEVQNPNYTFQFSFSENSGHLQFIKANLSYDLVQDEVVFPSTVSSTLVFYENVEKPHKKLRKPDIEVENVSLFEKAKYRPKFWKDNPIIKRTQKEDRVIATFEENNAFGTYFK